MKDHTRIIRLLIFVGFVVSINQGFTQVSDDFSDGDFADGNPLTWIASQVSGADDFVIVSGELNSNGPNANGDLSISTNYVIDFSNNDVVWTFKARNGNAPSDGNRIEIYLMANNEDVRAATEGYFIRMGENLSGDGIDFFRIDSGTPIISDPNNSVAAGINVNIRITRSNSGLWTLEADPAGGTSFVAIGTITDTKFMSGSYFGFRVIHTSTRRTDYFFDDFSIGLTLIPDTSSPTIISATAATASSIDVQFNEPVDQTTAENISNYALNNGATISAASLDGSDASLVHLTTSTLTNGLGYTLTLNNIEDVNGNVVITNTTANFTYLVFGAAGFRDVVINEFLSDPGGDSQMPNTDFVELYNPTDQYFNLAGWKLFDAVGSSTAFPSYTLAPQGYFIICDEEFVPEFETFGAVIGLATVPAFNNTNDEIRLYNQASELIDQVVYGSVASEGISNEQVNPDLICSGAFNFLPSEDEGGGTPGSVNSVIQILPDNFGPNIELVRAIESDSIRIDFDETINGAMVTTANITVAPSISVISQNYLSAYPNSIFVKLGESVTPNETYQVTVSGVADCSGNGIEENTGSFLLGATPNKGDILLSEVLFNPRTGGVDFVEIFNPSTTINYELKGWKLARLVDGEIDSPKPIAKEGQLIKTADFLVFTSNPGNISVEYPNGNSEKYVKLSSMPSYNDDLGTVVLLNELDEIIEQFDYSEDFHYALLETEDGVSLERISYDNEVNDPNNWRSAASTVNFGTPGRPNSQSKEFAVKSGKLTIDPKVFLPGNGGTGRDFTTINYELSSGGQFANIMIYDQQGRPVKQLANGASLATEGFFRWDGTTDRGGMARMGYYVVVFELYSGGGKTQTLQETVVVGRDF